MFTLWTIERKMTHRESPVKHSRCAAPDIMSAWVTARIAVLHISCMQM
jgi:hypothetical protein